MPEPDEQLSERQHREQEFYDTYRPKNVVKRVTFDYVFDQVSRPWNSYWCTYNEVFSRFRDPSQRLLDFGCGPGVGSIRYARRGYVVHGFDISEANIANCRMLAQTYGVADRTSFSSHVAEILPYDDEYFDVVVGMDILHHIDIPVAIGEVRRVLKPGGVAVFRECIEAPVWDAVRNWRLVTRFYPKEASFDTHITADERKINEHDLATITGMFEEYQVRRFGIVSRLHRLVHDPRQKVLGGLQRFDYYLTKVVPPIRKFGGELLLVLEKRQSPAAS